jgi:hypothetical protein
LDRLCRGRRKRDWKINAKATRRWRTVRRRRRREEEEDRKGEGGGCED